MSFWSHPVSKWIRDANPWLNHSPETIWNASLPTLYGLLVLYVIWKQLEPRRMTRSNLLFSKVVVPVLLTVFFVTGYLHLTVSGSMRDTMANAFTICLHFSAFFLIASFQPFYRERLTYESSQPETSHYIVLICIWFVMEYLIFFYFPPLKIPLSVSPGVRVYVDVIASLIVLGFPAVILRTVEDAWLCFNAPYFVYRCDNKEIGLIFKRNGVWVQNVREKPQTVPVRTPNRDPFGRLRPRRMRFRR